VTGPDRPTSTAGRPDPVPGPADHGAPHDAPLGAGGSPRRERARAPRWLVVFVVVGLTVSIVGVVGTFVRLPYTTLSPGGAVPLSGFVRVDGGPAYPDGRGDIRLLFVRERDHVNVWEYLRARLDSDVEIFPDKEVNPGGVPQPDLGAESQAEMKQARTAATVLALRAAGYDVQPAAEGVEVLAALPSRPAGDVLRAGDVILAADGVPIAAPGDLRDPVAKHGDGESVTLDILRDGERRTVAVGVEVRDGSPAMGVIVAPRYDFPVAVQIDTRGIGGPSGGLAMTLAVLDDLTAGNLTGGKRVAVTGTIDLDGNVGEIGGIAQKAVAARASGVDLLLVPACVEGRSPDVEACRRDLDVARERAGNRVEVVPVATFEEALQALRAAGGDPVDIVPAAGRAA